jgi:hypothetical protein
MNIDELRKRFAKEGISDNNYAIGNKSRIDRWNMEKRNNAWVVYYQSERGEKFGQKEFIHEEDACEYLYEEIVKLQKYETKGNYLSYG